jgi:DNA-binding MarR family transcriptional regulator
MTATPRRGARRGAAAAKGPATAADAEVPEFPLSAALDFLQRLWQLNHALEKLSSQMEKRIGVTAPQRMIVRCIGKYPGMAPSQLAAVLHLDPGTVSATLSRLEDKGFVVRRRDSEDKRRVSLGLTLRGRRLDQPTPGTVEHGMERLLVSARPADVAATRKLLSQLTGVLQEEMTTRRTAARATARGRRSAPAPGPRARR